MSGLDFTAAIEAAAQARWGRTVLSARLAWADLGDGFKDRLRHEVSSVDIEAAAPLIAAQVREQIAQEIGSDVGLYADLETACAAGAENPSTLADTVQDIVAARIARGGAR